MSRSFGGCLSRVVLLVLVAGALYAAWRWDPVVFPHVRERLGFDRPLGEEEARPTPELAEETLRRFEALLERGTGTLSLDADEVSSVLRFGMPGLLPPGVSDPVVAIAEGELRLEARVARELFPSLPDLESVVQMLPDTVPVELGLVVMPFLGEASALLLRRVEIAGFPLPRRFHPRILEAMGRRDQPGLPAEAMLVPLPPGLSVMYVDGDRLILVAGG